MRKFCILFPSPKFFIYTFYSTLCIKQRVANSNNLVKHTCSAYTKVSFLGKQWLLSFWRLPRFFSTRPGYFSVSLPISKTNKTQSTPLTIEKHTQLIISNKTKKCFHFIRLGIFAFTNSKKKTFLFYLNDQFGEVEKVQD